MEPTNETIVTIYLNIEDARALLTVLENKHILVALRGAVIAVEKRLERTKAE